MLFFNVLIGGTDAHAKNYSLLLSGNGALLAPMYDVASGLPYELLRRHGKLAMGVGGENRLGRIGSSAIERFVNSCGENLARIGITADFCTGLMANYAQRIPVLMEQVFKESSSVAGIDELQDHLLPHVEANVRKRSPYFKHLPQAPDSNARHFTLTARPAESTFISTNLSRAYGLVPPKRSHLYRHLRVEQLQRAAVSVFLARCDYHPAIMRALSTTQEATTSRPSCTITRHSLLHIRICGMHMWTRSRRGPRAGVPPRRVRSFASRNTLGEQPGSNPLS